MARDLSKGPRRSCRGWTSARYASFPLHASASLGHCERRERKDRRTQGPLKQMPSHSTEEEQRKARIWDRVAQQFSTAFSPGPDSGDPGSTSHIGLPAWSLLLPLPVSLTLSVSLMNK